MPIPPPVLDFWNEFVASTDNAFEQQAYESFAFGDHEALANELAALVLAGVKRATTGAVWSYEAEGERLPAPGDLSVVMSWAGQPLCVIETTSVEVLPFSQVSAEFAAAEGEGDRSLEFWRESHRAYFTRECQRVGREFTEDMLVSCERFKVVYQPIAPQGDILI
jgi:uncharacterized protein YhfF